MKAKIVLAVLFVVAVSSTSSGWLASAQQAQTSSTINLAYVTVQLSYPSRVQPGESITLSAQATSKEDLIMDRLVVQLYLPIQNDLQQIATATIAEGVAMKPGSQVSSDFKATIPSEAPGTSLMAMVTENVRLMTSTYAYSCPNGVCYFEQNTSYPQAQYIPKVPEAFESNDLSFAPLTYINAPSPVSSSSSPEQISNTLKLDFINVQLSYPPIITPGQSVTLTAKAVSHDNFEMDSLDAQVYIPIQNNLKQIAAGNIVSGVIMTTGSWVSRNISFTVPSDAPATSLLAVITEDVRFPPTANAFGYGHTVSVQQDPRYSYNYRMSPAPVGTQANTISYTALSYVNVNKPTNTSTQSQVQQSQTQQQATQQNPNDLTANQNQANQINTQSQTNPNTENVQLLEATVAILALTSAIAFLFIRRRKQMQSSTKQP